MDLILYQWCQTYHNVVVMKKYLIVKKWVENVDEFLIVKQRLSFVWWLLELYFWCFWVVLLKLMEKMFKDNFQYLQQLTYRLSFLHLHIFKIILLWIVYLLDYLPIAHLFQRFFFKLFQFIVQLIYQFHCIVINMKNFVLYQFCWWLLLENNLLLVLEII